MDCPKFHLTLIYSRQEVTMMITENTAVVLYGERPGEVMLLQFENSAAKQRSGDKRH